MHFQSKSFNAERNHEIANMPVVRAPDRPSWAALAAAFMAGVLVVAGMLNYV